MIINLPKPHEPPWFDKELNDHWFKLVSRELQNKENRLNIHSDQFRYLTFEELRFLNEKKSAYERVLQQTADFMKREAKLWKLNADLLHRAEEAESELKNMKEFIKTPPTLVLLPGGKEPPSTTSCWLEKLTIGTIFLTQEKNNPMDFNLLLFKLVAIEGEINKAYVLMSPSLEKPIYINPVRFCNKYNLYETIAVVEEAASTDEPKSSPKDITVDTDIP